MSDKPIPGEVYPGVICRKCSAPIAIRTPADEIDETFRARCPNCQESATYQRAEIQALQAHRKH